jgi:hypothetical protein
VDQPRESEPVGAAAAGLRFRPRPGRTPFDRDRPQQESVTSLLSQPCQYVEVQIIALGVEPGNAAYQPPKSFENLLALKVLVGHVWAVFLNPLSLEVVQIEFNRAAVLLEKYTSVLACSFKGVPSLATIAAVDAVAF